LALDPIKHLVEQLSRLPGIGERTGWRLVLHMLSNDRELLASLSEALLEVGQCVRECPQCHMVTTQDELCVTCASSNRDASVICMVATIQDLMAIEATNDFRGHYHVLHGVLSPMEGVGPRDLRLESFVQRIKAADAAVKELIIATPPTVEGEATALYVADQVKGLALKITRIASGVPVGGDLQFADRLTLSRSLALRRGF
jgi:recombination protein RecR